MGGLKEGADRAFSTASTEPAMKGLKLADKMFKSIITAIPGLGPFANLLEMFGEMTGIFEPFQAVLDVIGGLFQQMGAQILPVLMQVLQPLLNILLELTPVFTLIGKLVATVLNVALIPLQVFFEVLAIVLEPLKPLLDPLNKALEALQGPLNVLVHILVNVVLGALKIVANGFILFMNVIIGAINLVGNLVSFGLFPDIPTIPLLPLKEGTDFVPKTGAYMMHEGEQVLNRGERNEMISLLSSIDEEQKRAAEERRVEQRFARVSRI